MRPQQSEPTVIPRYTRRVKTAISIPDDVFEEAERAAAAHGMSRSQFFTKAARAYLQRLAAQDLTARIDAALDIAGPDDTASAAAAVGARALKDVEW